MTIHAITLYRPYISIKKSLESLTDELVFQCKLNAYLSIRAILNNEFKCDINKNPDIKFYYNNGNPYWKDLFNYYQLAHSEWNSRGGDNYNYLEKNNLYKQVKSLARKVTRTKKWTKFKQNKHRYQLYEYCPNEFSKFA